MSVRSSTPPFGRDQLYFRETLRRLHTIQYPPSLTIWAPLKCLLSRAPIRPSCEFLKWLYSPLLYLGRFFSFLIFSHSRLDSLDGGTARRKAATYTQNNTNRINAHRHPCLEWGSSPISQCWSGRRRFMP
jgi:hypothetical protein